MKGLRLIAGLIAVLLAAGGGMAPAALSLAAELGEFDRTTVEEDLAGYDLSGYKKTGEGEEEKIGLVWEAGVVEYAYSEDTEIADAYYGVYFYVFCSSGKKISAQPGASKVNISVAYDEEGKPSSYENEELTFLSQSADGLFIKLKLKDARSGYARASAYARKFGGKRRYDVAGIQLTAIGAQNAKDGAVEATYYYTGFSKGCGEDPEAESTLGSSYERLEVVKLDLQSTTYRFPYINQNGAGHQNQLDSVYFAVPKDINERYGELYSVKCTWNEQKTTPIIVTNNSEVYAAVKNRLGMKDNVSDKLGIFDNFSERSILPGFEFLTSPPTCVADWGWGYQYLNFSQEGHDIEETDGWIGSVGGVLVKEDTAPCYVFKSDESNIKNAQITSSQMKEWITSHKSASYLFAGSVDKGRTKGYQEHTFRADEPINMLTFNQTASGWDKFCLDWQAFWSFGRESWDFGPEEQAPVDPIRLVKDGDFTGKDAEDAEKLYVHAGDFADFERFYQENKSTKNVFLLRFAVTDYYSNMQTVLTGATWYNPTTWQTGTKDTESTYMARETVFLGFDIIELGFRDEQEHLTIIPVVASPIDIYPHISAPPSEDGMPWWVWCAAACGVLVVALAIAGAFEKGI